MTNSSHIKSCRNEYDSHVESCFNCMGGKLCPVANNLLDEFCTSIANHKDVENLTGTEAEQCTITKIQD